MINYGDNHPIQDLFSKTMNVLTDIKANVKK